MDDQFVDEILALSDEINKPCEGIDHYTVMCGLIEVLTDVMLEMESMPEYQEEDRHPGRLFADIFNGIIVAKREDIALTEAEIERDGATVH